MSVLFSAFEKTYYMHIGFCIVHSGSISRCKCMRMNINDLNYKCCWYVPNNKLNLWESHEKSVSERKMRVTLLHVFANNFGSICPIFKIQLLPYSELLLAAKFCVLGAEFAKRNNKTHAKIKRFTVITRTSEILDLGVQVQNTSHIDTWDTYNGTRKCYTSEVWPNSSGVKFTILLSGYFKWISLYFLHA